MLEDARTIRSVNWRTVFPFLNLFRAFRIAIHPSKLLLALALILVVYGAGRALDGLWVNASYPSAPEYTTYLPERTDLTDIPHSGPFDILLKWELSRFEDVTAAVVALSPAGVAAAVKAFAWDGPAWLFSHHWLYGLILTAVFLGSWAIFGGAIARVAAVQVARDAKISMRNALRFSTGKLLSFACAPIILAGFIGGLGLAIAVVNLAFYLPWVGPIFVGAIFIFTLAAGFIVTLALFGTIGGFGLLYPTVAVEGTDSFDAISRSFSYFFARPGKLVCYAAVALAYGVLTYLVVKVFVVIMVALVRGFQMWLLTKHQAEVFSDFFPGPSTWLGGWAGGDDRTGALVLGSNPVFHNSSAIQHWNAAPIGPFGMGRLSYEIPYARLPNAGVKVGASVLSFWYYLVVGLVGAYGISYFFSASTIIYTLLRLDVDATELDDVYLEDADDEDLLEAAPPASAMAPEGLAHAAGTVPPAAQEPGVGTSRPGAG